MRPVKAGIPSYAKTEVDQTDKSKQEEESSESNTDTPEKITYITSFGNEEPKMAKRPLYSEKLKENLDKFKNVDKRKKYSSRYSSTSSSSSDYDRRRKSRKSRNSSSNSSKTNKPQASLHTSPKE